jgi:hypothetical protein
MSTIKINYNLINNNWNITNAESFSLVTDVFFGFVSDKIPVLFNNLSFGIILKQNNEVLYTASFPKQSIEYLSTDQEFVEVIRLELQSNKQYVLDMWCKNSDNISNNSYNFTSPEIIMEPYPQYEVV